MEIHPARYKATDQRARRRKRTVCIGRQMDLANARLKGVNRKDQGVDCAVPTDHIQRALRGAKAGEICAAFDHQVTNAFIDWAHSVLLAQLLRRYSLGRNSDSLAALGGALCASFVPA